MVNAADANGEDYVPGTGEIALVVVYRPNVNFQIMAFELDP
jgi:hypothetical protein